MILRMQGINKLDRLIPVELAMINSSCNSNFNIVFTQILLCLPNTLTNQLT